MFQCALDLNWCFGFIGAMTLTTTKPYHILWNIILLFHNIWFLELESNFGGSKMNRMIKDLNLNDWISGSCSLDGFKDHYVRCLDHSYWRGNRLIRNSRSYLVCMLAPRCRLICITICIRFVFRFVYPSCFLRLRELGSERCQSVWSKSWRFYPKI